MLVYFKTQNNLSFNEEVEFSTIAGSYKDSIKGKELLSQNLIPLPKYNINLLKTSVIYGANASGKSNLLRCISSGVIFIVNSYINSSDSTKWVFQNQYNRLFKSNNKRPISYTYSIIVEGVMFEYTFSIDSERVTFETLLEYRTQKPITHFRREYNKKSKSYDWSKFSIYFTGEKETVKNITNERSLFLSVGNISELPICKRVCAWFQSKIVWSIDRDSPGNIDPQWALRQMMSDKGLKDMVLSFLKKADFSIIDIAITENKGTNRLEVKTYHKSIDKDGRPAIVEMDFYNEESTGTRRFLAWLGVWESNAGQNGQTILLDEFGGSMHTHLSKFLLEDFSVLTANKDHPQLIFTTHDTNLMKKELFRPDQIWIVDRDELGNSKLHSMSQFKLNKVKDIEQGYLDGLYGGIPYLKD
jgi:AAA15 family ATPase/GTPase